MSINYKLKHEDNPGVNPGVWDNSKLFFKATGPKDEIYILLDAIKHAIANNHIERTQK